MITEYRRIRKWFISKSALFRWGVKLVVTALFLYVVNRTLTLDQLKELAGLVSVPHLAFALLLGFSGLLFQVLRWHRVLQCLEFKVSETMAMKTMLWGILLGFVTPGRTGELLRGLKLDSNRKGDAVLASLIDRCYAILFTLLCGAAGMGVQVFIFGIAPEKRLLFPVLALVAVGLLLIAVLTYKNGGLCKTGPLRKLKDRYGNLPSALGSALGKRILFHTFASHAVLLLQTVLLFNMFGYEGFFRAFVAVSQAYTFMIFMPFFVANAGVREYSMTVFMQQSGVASSINIKAASAGVSTFIMLINIFLPALAGLLWVILEKRRRKAAPQIQHETTRARVLRENQYEK